MARRRCREAADQLTAHELLARLHQEEIIGRNLFEGPRWRHVRRIPHPPMCAMGYRSGKICERNPRPGKFSSPITTQNGKIIGPSHIFNRLDHRGKEGTLET